MFIQVMRGKVTDPDAFRRRGEVWMQEVRPGSVGWLGTTGGITDDGEAIVFARFESEEAARANSDRPEQGAWFAETAALFDGAPSFAESSDVEVFRDGGSDDAGFVQVMHVKTSRRVDVAAMQDKAEPILRQVHTGLIGGFTVWVAPDEAYEVNFFTDEAIAREGEKAMGEHPDAASLLDEWQRVFDSVTYLDLRDPILESA